jgi:hypothetical protein
MIRARLRKAGWLQGVLSIVALASATRAHVLPASVPELAQRSDRIVIADVTAVDSAWSEGGEAISSHVEVMAVSDLSGSGPRVFTLEVEGGRVGEVTMTVCIAPRFEVGDHVLLFLSGDDQLRLTGCFQGAWLCDAVDTAQMNGGMGSRVMPETTRPLERLLGEIESALGLPRELTVPPYSGSFSVTAAYTFELLEGDWTWMPSPIDVEFVVNPNCSDASAGSGSQQIDPIQAAANAWNGAGADFLFVYTGESTTTFAINDGINHVFFRDDPDIPDDALAFARTWVIDGELVDWDIVFNDIDHAFWNGVTGTCSNMADIESVATHELGHCLGLAHSAVSSATMAPSQGYCELEGQTLHQDDISGIVWIYGLSDIVWVDFSHGGIEDGTFGRPYDTMQEGLAAAPINGLLRVKGGLTTELVNTDKAVHVSAFSGTVIIGQ